MVSELANYQLVPQGNYTDSRKVPKSFRDVLIRNAVAHVSFCRVGCIEFSIVMHKLKCTKHVSRIRQLPFTQLANLFALSRTRAS